MKKHVFSEADEKEIERLIGITAGYLERVDNLEI
jgi:hypothetical protein